MCSSPCSGLPISVRLRLVDHEIELFKEKLADPHGRAIGDDSVSMISPPSDEGDRPVSRSFPNDCSDQGRPTPAVEEYLQDSGYIAVAGNLTIPHDSLIGMAWKPNRFSLQ